MHYYTVDRIKSVLRECEAEGINTFLGRGDNHICRLLVEYWNEGGEIQAVQQRGLSSSGWPSWRPDRRASRGMNSAISPLP